MLKTLGAYVKEYKKASIATPLFMILEVLMEMLIPYLLSSLIDNGVEKGDMGYILIRCSEHPEDITIPFHQVHAVGHHYDSASQQ